jgi:AAA family ATP:ADP antiporter
MNKASSVLRFFQYLCKFNFGTFEREEFKKFLRMGLIFAFMIGIYWTLRPLKDAIFIQFVGNLQLPFAKTISVLGLLPLVMFYTKLLEKYSRERMLVILPLFYSVVIIPFSILLWNYQASLISSQLINNLIGYGFYLFAESFGSIVIALFWAFSTDITGTTSAKRGFALVVAIGQMGGVLMPYTIGGLPHRLGHSTDTSSLLVLSILTLMIIPLVKHFLKVTPKALLTSPQEKKETKHEAKFLDGLKLLLNNRYLLGIFFVNFIYEVIITIFDFNFKIAASSAYSGVALTNYLSVYASSVNTVSLCCLLLGISNITRFLGVKIALAAMPVIVGVALFGFLTVDSLSFLFALMVGAKAINYALNGPALKQLYIPTTHDVKFKAQAWVETFGSRTSKQGGSIFNMSLSPLQSAFGTVTGKSYYLMMSGAVCFPLLVLWFAIAIFLGKSFNTAVRKNALIC